MEPTKRPDVTSATVHKNRGQVLHNMYYVGLDWGLPNLINGEELKYSSAVTKTSLLQDRTE